MPTDPWPRATPTPAWITRLATDLTTVHFGAPHSLYHDAQEWASYGRDVTELIAGHAPPVEELAEALRDLVHPREEANHWPQAERALAAYDRWREEKP